MKTQRHNTAEKQQGKADQGSRTHCCPKLSSMSLMEWSFHLTRIPMRKVGRKPFSAMMKKKAKKPLTAWIIPAKRVQRRQEGVFSAHLGFSVEIS